MSSNTIENNEADVSGLYRYRVSPYTNESHYLDNVVEVMNLDAALEHKINHTNDDAHLSENTTMRDYLYKEVRVLCWIMTGPANHKTKAIHVKNTWGGRCNKILFMSSAEDEELNAIALNVSEGRDNLWAKTKEAFKYIYAHHFDEADWFYKADDDTYALMENMRYMLYPYSSTYPIFFGFKFRNIVPEGYMSGGAGYVLSKEALRRFIEEALIDPKKCRQDHGGAEDVEMGKCLREVGVIPGDSRDSQGRGRFFVFTPESHLFPSSDKSFWYWKNMYYNTTDGMGAMSDYAISFHYIGPHSMWTMEYLIYHLRPYGIVNNPQVLPEKIALEEIMQNGTVIMTEHIDGEEANINTTTISSPTSNSDK